MTDHLTLRTIAALNRERAGVLAARHMPDDRKRSRLAAIDAELRRHGADVPTDPTHAAEPVAPVKRRKTAQSAAATTRTRRGGSGTTKE